MSKIKEVVELHLTTGDYSVFAKVICKNISDLQDILLNKINIIHGIQRTDTFISLISPMIEILLYKFIKALLYVNNIYKQNIKELFL